MDVEDRVLATRAELIDAVKLYYLERGVLLKVGTSINSRRVYLGCLAGESCTRRSQDELQ